jgi:transcription termination factor Rho
LTRDNKVHKPYLAKFDKAESLKRLVDTLKSTQSNKSMLEQFEKGVGDEK